jgi:hypothetical protein
VPVSEDGWKQYPYVPDWGDPAWFTFPAVDGARDDLGVSTYFIDGFLRGRTSGRRFAFMFIFTNMKVLRKRLRIAFYTMALYDLDRRRYGTYTDYDFPRALRFRRHHKLTAGPGHMDVAYESSAGTARWTNRRAGDVLLPFAYALALPGVDHHGERMSLELEVDCTRPPGPLGGRELGGEMMFLGAPSTFSYFQSGLDMRGRLAWGDHAEDVEGEIGWIDRQWAVSDFSTHQDRHSSRYRTEWRVMQFDNGWDMSLFHQYQRDARAAVVPWSGMSAQGPAPRHEIRSSTRVQLVIPEFIRSPGIVRGKSMLTEGPRWFPHRYRVCIPEWQMDVQCEPLVDAPAHALPIEYWTGPVRITGSVWGNPVTGFGFDERSRPWTRDWELAQALRLTVEHLVGLDDDTRRALAYRAWEVEALALRGDPREAIAHVERRIAPLLRDLSPSAGERVRPLVGDLLETLSGRHRTR